MIHTNGNASNANAFKEFYAAAKAFQRVGAMAAHVMQREVAPQTLLAINAQAKLSLPGAIEFAKVSQSPGLNEFVQKTQTMFNQVGASANRQWPLPNLKELLAQFNDADAQMKISVAGQPWAREVGIAAPVRPAAMAQAHQARDENDFDSDDEPSFGPKH